MLTADCSTKGQLGGPGVLANSSPEATSWLRPLIRGFQTGSCQLQPGESIKTIRFRSLNETRSCCDLTMVSSADFWVFGAKLSRPLAAINVNQFESHNATA